MKNYHLHSEKELHLLEYHAKQLEYVMAFGARRAHPIIPNPLENFSSYEDLDGYNDTSAQDLLNSDLQRSRTGSQSAAASPKNIGVIGE